MRFKCKESVFYTIIHMYSDAGNLYSPRPIFNCLHIRALMFGKLAAGSVIALAEVLLHHFTFLLTAYGSCDCSLVFGGV